MSNATPAQKINSESPKTPGGISKSLLTPCRRVGLSRKWKARCSSSFISPVSTTSDVDRIEAIDQKETRVHQHPTQKSDNEETREKCVSPTPACNDTKKNILSLNDVDVIPVINVQNSKSSKIFNRKFNNGNYICDRNSFSQNRNDDSICMVEKKSHPDMEMIIGKSNVPEVKQIKSNISNIKPAKQTATVTVNVCKDTNEFVDVTKDKNKIHSPNELTKACVVLLQKKMFKANTADLKHIKECKEKSDNIIDKSTISSQGTFDSDSDDVPLKILHMKSNDKIKDMDDSNDFIEESMRQKVKRVRKSTTNGKKCKLGSNPAKLLKLEGDAKVNKTSAQPCSQSSNSVDEEDDAFEMTNKRTILIRKTYDKVTKPIKSKSTGSITKQTIEELRSRIETKKNLLLAKSVNKDTEELRSLVKKWQKGCQDALIELINLMKKTIPEQQNMSYSEILCKLKIPSKLVGYDPENDCFISPDDASIILDKFND